MKATLILLSAAALTSFAAESLTVEAGDFDRRETIVEFKLPTGVKANALVDSAGQSTALQVNPDGRAWFIERDLKRGARKTYTLGNAGVRQTVAALGGDGSVTFQAFGKTGLVYRTEKTELPPNRPDLTPIFQRGGYIHPVLSPSGKQITDDYPSNHKHHHGIWFAWTHTE